MAKTEVKKEATKRPKPDGTEGNPHPWVAPFPHRAHLDDDAQARLAKDKAEILQAKAQGEDIDEKAAAVLLHDGRDQEPVFVRAKVRQDLIINGVKRDAGASVVVDTDFAHAHAHALTAPDPIPEPVMLDTEDDEE